MDFQSHYARPHMSDVEDEEFIPRPIRRAYSKSADDIYSQKEETLKPPPFYANRSEHINKYSSDKLPSVTSATSKTTSSNHLKKAATDVQLSLLRSHGTCLKRSREQKDHQASLAMKSAGNQIKDLSFQIDIWLHETSLEDIEMRSLQRNGVVSAALEILEELEKRTKALEGLCKDAAVVNFDDAKDDDETSSEDYDFESDDGGYHESDPESIQFHLVSMAGQLQTLGILTNPLRDLIHPNREELEAQARVVKNVEHYQNNGMKHNENFTGRKALEEAIKTARIAGKLFQVSNFAKPSRAGQFLSPEHITQTRPRTRSVGEPHRSLPAIPPQREPEIWERGRHRETKPSNPARGENRRKDLLLSDNSRRDYSGLGPDIPAFGQARGGFKIPVRTKLSDPESEELLRH